VRARLGRIWEAADDEERAVAMVNALLADTHASLWLTRHPEMSEWHLHVASQRDPLAQRLGAEFAMALADLIRVGELRRLKICAAPDCEAVVWTCPAIGHACSASPEIAATANMLRLTANGARRTGNVDRRGFEPA
jgi:hypothetical protein